MTAPSVYCFTGKGDTYHQLCLNINFGAAETIIENLDEGIEMTIAQDNLMNSVNDILKNWPQLSPIKLPTLLAM